MTTYHRLCMCSWPLRWQEKLAGLGYRSSYIHLDKTDTTSSRLDIWYKGNQRNRKQVKKDLWAFCSKASYTYLVLSICNDTIRNDPNTDLVQAMQEHTYFPPLLIGHGDDAWKTCQKYVCNKPVSGLVLIHHDHANGPLSPLPSFEFEPHFPLCVMAPMGKVPPFLQDEQVDHVETSSSMDTTDTVLQHTLKWMDDANM